tara:strand:- start:47 stop:400 length:354 start_codon:yes stop_codon:yes gene_type:complete
MENIQKETQSSKSTKEQIAELEDEIRLKKLQANADLGDKYMEEAKKHVSVSKEEIRTGRNGLKYVIKRDARDISKDHNKKKILVTGLYQNAVSAWNGDLNVQTEEEELKEIEANMNG